MLRPFVLGVVLMGQSVLSGCGPKPSPRAIFHERLREAVTVIRDGDGYEKCSWSGETYFAFYFGALDHPCEDMRASTAASARSCVHMAATYPVLLDAFIDYGPVEELRDALLRGWRRADPMSDERYFMANAFVELEERQYLWAHPELGKQKGLMTRAEMDAWVRESLPDVCFSDLPPVKGWEGFPPGWFSKELLAEGNEQYKQVWEDYQRVKPLWGDRKLRGTVSSGQISGDTIPISHLTGCGRGR